MYITPLDFKQVLNRFYQQSNYSFLLLFVSSFDENDKNIIRDIVDNASRIDRITGEKICFFYFRNDPNCNDFKESEKLIRWVKDLPPWKSLYDEGVSVTIETADDICRHFGLLRTELPAFILIDQKGNHFLFSIQDYQDFERFLSPLNVLHSYIEDNNKVLSSYETQKQSIILAYQKKRKRTVVTQYDVDKRIKDRSLWEEEIKRLIRRKEIEISNGEVDRAKKREETIEQYKKKLEDCPELVVCEKEDETVPYPKEEIEQLYYPKEALDNIRKIAIDRLNQMLNTHEGDNILVRATHGYYYESILEIWELVRTRTIRISRIIQRIRFEIQQHGFDVFISCKSQDYSLAYELYEYLKAHGFIPFLADPSIKEVGIDHYTAVIGEVINACSKMIVFATDVNYLETPYVFAEWNLFVNSINTGRIREGKLINILSPEIDVNLLPSWLGDKQSFTTENYRDDLLHFLV